MRDMTLSMAKDNPLRATAPAPIAVGGPASDTTHAQDLVGTLFPLIVNNLVFEAGGRRLIDGLDLTLERTGTTMIMGPNGAGKSLLLRLIHGLLQPMAGTIEWGGQFPSDTLRRFQALVTQKPVLLRRSVAENIDFVLRTLGRANADARDALLGQVGLLELRDQPARKLSGGEQQRLSLARALAINPSVLMLDEPTASLDPASVLVIEQLVNRAASRGVKVIFITHDLGQTRRLGGDVVFMHRGRVAEHTSVEDFFEAPKSQAVRDFVAGRIVL